MTTRKTRVIKSSLKKKGFRESTNDHYWYVLYYRGKKSSIRTRVSHGKGEYGNSLLGKMAGQLKLSGSQLLDLIDCPMDQEDYIRILLEDEKLS